MISFICDYAKASPAVIANKIEKFFDLGNSPMWCKWEDKDEKRYYNLIQFRLIKEPLINLNIFAITKYMDELYFNIIHTIEANSIINHVIFIKFNFIKLL